ncbi:hypothetical protein NEOLEDRAFT_638705 [Neolentinus lepideus HHB14362 ss-1]|uniref:Exocyst complex component EXO84 n=1 Tax=Neolentinus lepideus HHB14362 ss-1 TaxID=1314782 RepID=A0A165QP17_9AGAM|nr:hypothetical protein NEOLEDRAFT_638705 [Neolentinus lepideus HHB14362 ss-1]
MQSLRTRKPSSGRQAKRQPTTRLAKSSAPARDARKSRVDDKIKKRMSTRYADISGPTGVTNIPAVPALPIGTRPLVEEPEEMGREVLREDPKVAEMKLLDKDDFDPDAYLKVKLANSTEAELKSLQSSLRSAKDDVAADLQKNVFKNYAEFVLVSKEISVLENEMLELKESLSEWKSMPSLLHIDDSASAAERRRNVRSSVADLRILYANQMQTLHSQIEGSTKFVPTTPGRHVLTEVDGIFALNAATYKVERVVKFVVLDDAVLVARRRRRKGEEGEGREGGKLVAERCWMLSDMLVLDTKDTASMTNVFKIRYGKETHVYRAETPADKKNLLSYFRQAAEELQAKKRKEREGEHERRKSLWAGGDEQMILDKIPPMPDWMSDLAQAAGMGIGPSAKEKVEKDARWMGEFTDELTVAIALREWDRAVELVEQGEASLSTTPLLAGKLPPLTQTLTASLLAALSAPSPALRKSTAVHLISLLNRLRAGPAARTAFLAARGEAIRRKLRGIRVQGDVRVYVNELSVVVFTGVKHTADWFLASFRENEVASCFVDWAKNQLENYAEIFRKQVYTSDADPQTIEEALAITHSQSRKLLEEFGLDFRFLLSDLLVPDPKSTGPPPFPMHPHVQIRAPEPTRTPSTTPVSGRSTPVPVPPLPASSPVPLAAPTPIPPRMRSPTISARERPPRSVRGSPAPPPRSRDRPGSAGGRAAPVAVKAGEGMF